MSTKKHDINGLFKNEMAYFKNFDGILSTSAQIQLNKIHNQHVAIIGIDQYIASQLHKICLTAASVQIFQTTSPHWVLPHTPRMIQSLIFHPLVVKNRRLFSTRIKSLVALRFLEREVTNPWLKCQLTPNFATTKKDFLKSDDYYQALQLKNCKLNTWPITHILGTKIFDLQGQPHHVDQIITTCIV